MKVLNPRRFEMCHFILKHIEALERKFREFGYDKELAPREDTRLKAYKKVEHINI